MGIREFLSGIFSRKKKIIGVVKIARNDYSYIIPNIDIGGDIFVSKKKLNYAINGDTVEVKYIHKKNRDGKYIGEVVKIIKRGVSHVLGTFDKRESGYSFNITSFCNYYNVTILNKDKINAKLFPCRAEAKIINYPSKKNDLECEIIDIFGPVGDDVCEFNMILRNYNIVPEFSNKILSDAESLSNSISEEEIRKRCDFRNIFTLTIDPKNSMDFDDAISIIKNDDGSFQLGIHIADVSHFVKEGTDLDKEAFRRNTSVYFIDKVVPMLPDILCNNICSLLPNEDRLVFSVILDVDKDFNILNTKICESVIHSNLRLTYEEAQDILDNETLPYHDEMSTIMSFSKYLKQKRIDGGALNFNFYNVNFGLDDDNNLIIEDSQQTDSHVLIEELMILANNTVAEYASKLNKNDKNKTPVFIYRVHPKPEKWKVIDFCRFLNEFQIFLNPNSTTFENDLNKILLELRGKDIEWIVSTLAARMMQKAYYSTTPIGHYGLSLDYYSHFTSPIRRYNDILIHRLLKKYLKGNYEYETTKYESDCKYSLLMEKNAVDAEREYIKFKQVKLLKKREGEKVEGIISMITEWGIFVELIEAKCVGLIRVSSIDNDVLVYDNEGKYIYGKFTGNLYKIGDKVDVVILKSNIEQKTVDLSFF